MFPLLYFTLKAFAKIETKFGFPHTIIYMFPLLYFTLKAFAKIETKFWISTYYYIHVLVTLFYNESVCEN